MASPFPSPTLLLLIGTLSSGGGLASRRSLARFLVGRPAVAGDRRRVLRVVWPAGRSRRGAGPTRRRSPRRCAGPPRQTPAAPPGCPGSEAPHPYRWACSPCDGRARRGPSAAALAPWPHTSARRASPPPTAAPATACLSAPPG